MCSYPPCSLGFKPSVQKAHLHAHCGFHFQQVQQIVQWHSGLTAPSPQRAERPSQRLTCSGQLLGLIAAPRSTERRDLPASPGREPVQEGARLCRLATPPASSGLIPLPCTGAPPHVVMAAAAAWSRTHPHLLRVCHTQPRTQDGATLQHTHMPQPSPSQAPSQDLINC